MGKQQLLTFVLTLFAVSMACIGLVHAQDEVDPEMTESWESIPSVVIPGAGSAPPSDAVVLLDDDLSAWTVWHKRANNSQQESAVSWDIKAGILTVDPGSGGIQTKKSFGSIQLHLEWRAPLMETSGQQKGNSGVFLQERYEVQILDSYENRTYSNGQAASVYKQYSPAVNASRPPEHWQNYDIVFNAPEFDHEGSPISAAYITVFHNGVLVQNHVRVLGETSFRGNPAYQAHGDAPLALQDHGDRVSFRNIWIREL